MKNPVRVTITGAAGNIGYALAFRVAAGDMLGPDQPVILQLLEITPALDALKGVAMELNDCAFPLLRGLVTTDDANVAFKDCDYALLVGARPRGPGMERKDLLAANGAIFGPQGKALNDHASRHVKVLVVGNPANTNALIAQAAAPDLNPRNFTAMTRLDHNRALSQLAEKTGTHSTDIAKMTIWGNHSSTQYPDISHATVQGKAAKGLVEDSWYKDTFIPVVQQPRLTTCAPGRWAPMATTGSAWAYRPTAPTASPPASSTPTPAAAKMAITKSCKGWKLTPSAAKKWTRPSANCVKNVPPSKTCLNKACI